MECVLPECACWNPDPGTHVFTRFLSQSLTHVQFLTHKSYKVFGCLTFWVSFLYPVHPRMPAPLKLCLVISTGGLAALRKAETRAIHKGCGEQNLLSRVGKLQKVIWKEYWCHFLEDFILLGKTFRTYKEVIVFVPQIKHWWSRTGRS